MGLCPRNRMPATSFSIVTPTHNRAELVCRAVSSVLAHTNTDLDVIVVDDGSTDGTASLLEKRFRDSWLRVIRQTNQGATAARNRGGFEARNDWLVFLDSDDELTPTACEVFSEAIDGVGVGVVCGAAEILAPNGQSQYVKRPRDLGASYNDHRGLFLAGTFAVRRDVFLALKGFSTECRANQQKEFALRLVPYCDEHDLRIVATDAVTVRVHEHDGEHLRSDMESLLDGSLYIIRNHEQQIRKSSRHYADWCSITAVYAAKLGRLDVARKLLFGAVRCCPSKAINFARLLLACCPPLARRVWRGEG